LKKLMKNDPSVREYIDNMKGDEGTATEVEADNV